MLGDGSNFSPASEVTWTLGLQDLFIFQPHLCGWEIHQCLNAPRAHRAGDVSAACTLRMQLLWQALPLPLHAPKKGLQYRIQAWSHANPSCSSDHTQAPSVYLPVATTPVLSLGLSTEARVFFWCLFHLFRFFWGGAYNFCWKLDMINWVMGR